MNHCFLRSSRMRHSFFLAIHQASAQWYLPWTTLTTILWLQPKTLNIRSQFVLHLQLENELLIDTTTKQITQRFTGLQWASPVWVASLVQFLTFSLVLHPRHKLHYFKTAGWKDDWIETLHDIVCEEFDRTYAFMDFDGSDEVIAMDKVWKHFKFCDCCCWILSTSRHHRLQIFSMIYLHFQHQKLRSFVTSLIDTSAQILSKSQMSASGGTKRGWCIPAFIAWPSITLQFQVCKSN